MIELHGISRTYHMGGRNGADEGALEVRALRDIDLVIEQGEFVAIIGSSGSGKSTLLHIIGLLDRPDSGQYLFFGRDTTSLTDSQLARLRNRLAGFVFQQFHLLPRASAEENVSLPLVYSGETAGGTEVAGRLDAVGLGHRLGHTPDQLSGGEQQRVAVARALVNDPLLILADEPTGNLDSRSEGEIIALMEDLHSQGRTIVMVTHEKEIARRAERVIEMRDGDIVSDERTGAAQKKDADQGRRRVTDILEGSGRQTVAGFSRHMKQSLRAIFAHKMRSILSMLGILIGVGAVIAMMAIAGGAKEFMQQQLSRLGSNLVIIRPGAHRIHGVRLQAGEITRFTIDDARAVESMPLVNRVSAYVSGGVQAAYGGNNWNTRLMGTEVDYAPMRASEPQSGRFFTPQEIRDREKVAVLGTTVVEELYGGKNPLGTTIKIQRVNFRVIGVLPYKGGSHWRDWDDVIIVPISTAMYRVLGDRYVEGVFAEVVASDRMERAKDEILELMGMRHRIDEEDREERIQIRDLAEIKEVLSSTTKTMSLLLGAIAAISLLVGGIGIMNIMLVSVTERTREIGLRKAIGASRSDIMVQFLIESVMLTLMGGIIGVLLGVSAAWALTYFAQWPRKITLLSIFLATGFAMVIGIIFGLWPARQASRLDPVEALRYE